MDTLPPKPVVAPRSPPRENIGRHDADGRDRDSGRRPESSYRDSGGRRDDRSDRRYDDRPYSSRPRQDAEPYSRPRYSGRDGPRRNDAPRGRGRGYGRRDYDGRGSDSRSSWSRREDPPDGWSRSGGRDDRDRDRDRDRGEYHRDDDRRRRDGPSSHDGRHRETTVDSWVPDSRRSDYGDRQRRSRSPRRRPSSPPPPRSPSDSRYSRPKSPERYSSPPWRPPPREDTPPPRTSPPRVTINQEESRAIPPLKEESMPPVNVQDPVKNDEQRDIKPSPIKPEAAVWGRSLTPIKAEPTSAPPPKREYPSEPPVNVINARPVDDRVKDTDVKMRDQSDTSIPTHPRHHLRTTNLDRVQSPHSRLDSPSGSSHPIQRRSSPPRFNRQVSDRHSRYDGPPNRLNKPYHHKHEPDKIYPQLASAELNRIFPLKFEEPIPLPSELQQMHAKREQFRKSALIFCKQRAALVQVELQLAEALREVDLASIDVATAKSRQRAIEHTIASLEAVPTSEPSSSSGQPSEGTNTTS